MFISKQFPNVHVSREPMKTWNTFITAIKIANNAAAVSVPSPLKAPGWKTGSTSCEMYRRQQQQCSRKQWAVDLGV